MSSPSIFIKAYRYMMNLKSIQELALVHPFLKRLRYLEKGRMLIMKKIFVLTSPRRLFLASYLPRISILSRNYAEKINAPTTKYRITMERKSNKFLESLSCQHSSHLKIKMRWPSKKCLGLSLNGF